MVVEQIGHEGQIQLVDAVDDVLGREEAAAVQLGRLLEHDLRPALQVRLPEGVQIDVGIVAGDLLEEMRVDLRVDNVRLEVGATTRDAGTLQVMVHPAQEDGLRGHLHEVLQPLVVEEEAGQARAAVQGDVAEEADADDLPEEAQDQMGLALGQVVGVDVDDVAADGLGGDQGEGQILKLPVDGQVLLVDRPLVDRVRAGVVDDLAQQDAVLDALVEALALPVDGQEVLQVLVVAQVRVDPVGEGQLLLESHRVGGALRGDARHAAESLEVLLLGDDRLEGTGHVLALQVEAQGLELLQVELALVGGALFAFEFVDHLAHLVAGQLEAHLVEGVLQLVQVDEAILVGVQLEER